MVISPPAASKTPFYPVLVQNFFSPLRGENVSSPQPFDISGDLDPWGVDILPHHPRSHLCPVPPDVHLCTPPQKIR